MYGLPKDFDGTFLVGCTLEMICFNQNQVYLHFSKDITITIESAFSFTHIQSGDTDQIIHIPIVKSNLMVLLEASVLEVHGNENGTLCLTLDNDYVLKCYDTEAPYYESYIIKHGDEEIIV